MNIAILGAGAWGTAIAIHLLKSGNRVTLAPRRFEHALELSSERENYDYLPGYRLSDDLQIGWELSPVLMEAELIILACPSSGLRSLCKRVAEAKGQAKRLQMVISLCKGLEKGSLETPSQVLQSAIPELPHGVLSGPTNAEEVASGKPTAIVLASKHQSEQLQNIQNALSGPSVRVYLSKDIHGVELGGCLKNIYAIGAGICDGIGLGDNAKSAFITRSLNEMAKLGAKLGGQMETFYGLSGVGDLIATCNGSWSRNRTFGEELAKGGSVASLMGHRKTVVEGYWATQCFHDIVKKNAAQTPILEQIYSVLYHEVTPAKAIQNLMSRELKSE